MKNSTDDAKQTAAKTEATKPETTTTKAKAPEVTRAEAVAKRISQLNKLEKLAGARAELQFTSDQIREAQGEINQSDAGNWDKEKEYRVSFAKHDNRPIFSFSQKALLNEFLKFMEQRIIERITQIDETLLSEEL